LKGGVRVQGILAAATPADQDLSLALRQAVYLDRDVSNAVPKPSLLINGRDLLEIDASDLSFDSPGPQNGTAPATENIKRPTLAVQNKETDSFRIDVDISNDRLRASVGQGRQLQAWGGLEDDSLEGGIDGGSSGGGGGGFENGGRGWDQFAANERQFGLKTDYDEEIYTTKLDKSGKDYKSREARAAQLEREIMKVRFPRPALSSSAKLTFTRSTSHRVLPASPTTLIWRKSAASSFPTLRTRRTVTELSSEAKTPTSLPALAKLLSPVFSPSRVPTALALLPLPRLPVSSSRLRFRLALPAFLPSPLAPLASLPPPALPSSPPPLHPPPLAVPLLPPLPPPSRLLEEASPSERSSGTSLPMRRRGSRRRRRRFSSRR
jgi:hypothetical protein